MTQTIFVMELFIVLALTFCVNANPFSNDKATSNVEFIDQQEIVQVGDLQGKITIVMDDLIAKADTQDPTDVITSFRVYDTSTNQLLFEDTSCNASACDFDLSGLSPANYKVEADSANGKEFRGIVAVQ